MRREQLLVQLQADIDKLTRPFNHTEAGLDKPHHSRHGSLLDQLADELTESTPAGEGGSKPMPASKPPVREEVSVLIWEAERESVQLVNMTGGKVRPEVSDNFAQLPSLLTGATDELVAHVVGQVSALRGRIETQLTWQLRPRRLSGNCPQCRKKDSLVVFLDGYGPTQAKCQKCHTVWPKETLGILAGSLEMPDDQSA